MNHQLNFLFKEVRFGSGATGMIAHNGDYNNSPLYADLLLPAAVVVSPSFVSPGHRNVYKVNVEISW